MLQFPVGISIEAIDKATAKTKAISGGIAKAVKPLQKIGEAFKGLGEAAGFPKLMEGFRGVGEALGGLVEAAKKATLYIGGAITAAAVSVFELVKTFAEAGESALLASRKIGISIEALEILRYAASRVHLESDALDRSLVVLARNAALAARGQRSAAAPFHRLGIQVKDTNGHIRNAADLIAEIADKFGRLDDPAKKAALAGELFGKKLGANLIPLLDEGSRGLAEASKRARELGIVLSKDDAEAGEEFMRALNDVGAALRGVRNTMGRELLPIVKALAEEFRDWLVAHLPAVREFAKRLAKELPDAIAKARAAFESFWEKTEPVRRLLMRLYDVIGPVGLAIGAMATVLVVTLVPAIASTVAALATLSAALVGTPAGWVVLALTAIALAIAAVVAAVGLLIYHWDFLSDRFPRLTALAESLGAALLENVLGPFVMILTALEKVLDLMEQLSNKIPDWVLSLAGVDTDALKEMQKQRAAGGSAGGSAGSSSPDLGQTGSGNTAGDFAAAMREMRLAAEAANKARPGSIPLSDTLAAGAQKKNEATVHVDFSNMPKGARVSSETKGDAQLDLSMGYALSAP